MTKYQVFRKSTAGTDSAAVSFEPLGEFEAADPKGAVKAAVLAMTEADRAASSSGSFAACASSSWQELTPRVNVETTVSFA